jgi:iron complex transport system ATP-binding protein
MIHCQSLTLKLPHHQLGPINLKIEAGQTYALIGPSGAGKSTFLRLLCGGLKPDDGDIHLDQKPLNDWHLKELSRIRAVLPQSHAISFDLPVDLLVSLGRVDMPLSQYDLKEALRIAHASHLIDRQFHTLSGGECARVQLARIFYQLWNCQNGYLFMDEPVASLDPGLQHEILQSAITFSKDRNLALLTIVHDMNQANQYFDHILMLDRYGKIKILNKKRNPIIQLEILYEMKLKIVTDIAKNSYFMSR